MPHVLITGGAGYLGCILTEHLLAAAGGGHSVTVLDNLYFNQSPLFHFCANPRFNFVLGDARNESLIASLLKNVDVIIPLAAVVGAPACDRDPYLAQSLNCDAVVMVNRLRSPRQLILYPNTNSGYGMSSGTAFCTEDTPLEPISLYGRSKCEAETAVLEKPNAIVLRLATAFGASPRMRIDLLVNHFVYAAASDGYIVIFEKDFKRNFVHIRDIADAFCFGIQNAPKMSGRPYNLGLDSANFSKAELALKIKEFVPKFFVHFSELGSDPDKRNYIVSSQRLKDAGFQAQRTLEEGIRELLVAFRLLGRHTHKNI